MTKEKQKTRKNKLNIKLLLLCIIILIFAVCSLYNIISLFLNPTNTLMIENGKISSTEETIGYIIREEKVFKGENYKNGISPIKNEGQRIAKGESIFRYYTNNEESITKKIADLDSQIQDALGQSNGVYSSDITSIDRQIEDRLIRISSLNKANDIKELKKEISNSLIKKAKLVGELSPSGSYIKDLISKRSKYEEQLNSGSEYIESTISGMVSYKIDGLEETLTPNNFEQINEEYLNGLKLKTGELVPTSSEGGKVFNNYCCYIATIINVEESQDVKEGESVQIVLSTGEEIKAEIKHIAEQTSGKRLIIFKIINSVEKLVSYRKISLNIVWWKANGLKVPNTAIVDREGKKYIIRKRIGYTDDILIKVLKTSDNYSIVDNYTSLELKELGYTTEEIKNMKNISLYDEILLKPSK